MTSQSPILLRMRPQCAISLMLIMTLALNVQAQSADTTPRTVTLKQGQVLQMSLVKSLSSRHAKVGDDIVLRLKEPLVADGTTVLPAKSVVHGRVTDVKPAAKNCQPGSIQWQFESLTMADGRTVAIQSIPDDVAQSRLRDQRAQEAQNAANAAGVSPRKMGKTRGIAEGVAAGAIYTLIMSMFVLSDLKGYGNYPCNKGSERKIRSGTTFYAEIVNDDPLVVD